MSCSFPLFFIKKATVDLTYFALFRSHFGAYHCVALRIPMLANVTRLRLIPPPKSSYYTSGNVDTTVWYGMVPFVYDGVFPKDCVSPIPIFK